MSDPFITISDNFNTMTVSENEMGKVSESVSNEEVGCKLDEMESNVYVTDTLKEKFTFELKCQVSNTDDRDCKKLRPSIGFDQTVKDTEVMKIWGKRKNKTKNVSEGLASKRLCGPLWRLDRYTSDWDELLFGCFEKRKLGVFENYLEFKNMDAHERRQAKVQVFKDRLESPVKKPLVSERALNFKSYEKNLMGNDEKRKRKFINVFTKTAYPSPKYAIGIYVSDYGSMNMMNYSWKPDFMRNEHVVHFGMVNDVSRAPIPGHSGNRMVRDFPSHNIIEVMISKECFIEVFLDQEFSKLFDWMSDRHECGSDVNASCDDIPSDYSVENDGHGKIKMPLIKARWKNRKLLINFFKVKNLRGQSTYRSCYEVISCEIDANVAWRILNTVVQNTLMKSIWNQEGLDYDAILNIIGIKSRSRFGLNHDCGAGTNEDNIYCDWNGESCESDILFICDRKTNGDNNHCEGNGESCESDSIFNCEGKTNGVINHCELNDENRERYDSEMESTLERSSTPSPQKVSDKNDLKIKKCSNDADRAVEREKKKKSVKHFIKKKLFGKNKKNTCEQSAKFTNKNETAANTSDVKESKRSRKWNLGWLNPKKGGKSGLNAQFKPE